MGRILKTILLEYLQYRSAETSEDFLFPNAYGEPMSVRTLEKSVKSYNNKRGVMRSGLHIFRNVYAKKWIIAGGDNLIRYGYNSKIVNEIYGFDVV